MYINEKINFVVIGLMDSENRKKDCHYPKTFMLPSVFSRLTILNQACI